AGHEAGHPSIAWSTARTSSRPYCPNIRPRCSPPGGPWSRTVESANDCRTHPLASAACDHGRMDQSPPTTRHRIPGGGEPGAQGATDGAPPPADRRSAPTPRREGAPARWTRLAAGRHDRDARHNPSVAPPPDRPAVDVRAEATRPSRTHAGDLVPQSAD